MLYYQNARCSSAPFTLCHGAVPPGTFLPRCVESVCDCLTAGTPEDECKCSAMARYVTKCLEADTSIQVLDWRVVAKCCESLLTRLVTQTTIMCDVRTTLGRPKSASLYSTHLYLLGTCTLVHATYAMECLVELNDGMNVFSRS